MSLRGPELPPVTFSYYHYSFYYYYYYYSNYYSYYYCYYYSGAVSSGALEPSSTECFNFLIESNKKLKPDSSRAHLPDLS